MSEAKTSPKKTARSLHLYYRPIALSIVGASEYSGVPRTCLREAIGRGDLPSVSGGKGRLRERVVILTEDLEAWLRSRRESRDD